MLVEKEVIRPGSYWYRDEATGQPRKLVVTPELTRYWHEQGNAMLATGLTVPVPCEHDFNAHPMTPAEKLKNNAGWVRSYSLKGDALFSSVDVEDEALAAKLPKTIRWTSPWINSFTDGNGKEWKNVISHLALTTRPRIIDQEPFGSIAAALSMATPSKPQTTSEKGYCLSRAGLLDEKGQPVFSAAFSIWSGVKLSGSDEIRGSNRGAQIRAMWAKDPLDPSEYKDFGVKRKPTGRRRKKKKGKGKPFGIEDMKKKTATQDDDEYDYEPADADKVDGEDYEYEYEESDDVDADDPSAIDMNGNGSIEMEEILCHLLQALGVPMPDQSNKNEFHRHLYEAAMSKIKELTSKGMGKEEAKPDQNKPPTQQPNASQPKQQPNPLIQQEPQPMFMSLEEINQLPDPMKGVALSWYNENAKLQAQVEANQKVTDGLRNKQLEEAKQKRAKRVALINALSPRAKADLDAMLSQDSMALSMDDKGNIIDPMAQTLAVLEKGLSDLPQLFQIDAAHLSVQQQPTDADELTGERADEIADVFARQMGCVATK